MRNLLNSTILVLVGVIFAVPAVACDFHGSPYYGFIPQGYQSKPYIPDDENNRSTSSAVPASKPKPSFGSSTQRAAQAAQERITARESATKAEADEADLQKASEADDSE